jgi:hypothetical protein
LSLGCDHQFFGGNFKFLTSLLKESLLNIQVGEGIRYGINGSQCCVSIYLPSTKVTGAGAIVKAS